MILPSILALGLLLAPNARAGGCCTNGAVPGCCASSEAITGKYSDDSVYQLNRHWTNDYGAATTLATQKGRVQIVTMFFARCQYACPMLVEKMKRVEAALPAGARSNVAFTLVSLDCEFDTPAALHDYRALHGLGPSWTLLHGNADDVLELAALLDVKFKKSKNGQFQHSNLITVLDQNGEIAYQEPGLGLETTAIVHQIEDLLKHGGGHATH